MDLEKPQALMWPQKLSQQINNDEHKLPQSLHCIKIVAGLIHSPIAHAKLFYDWL